MKAFAEFKSVWDPENKLNPHKVVDAYLPTENLRLGADYKPLEPKLISSFLKMTAPFAKAAARCFGSGPAGNTTQVRCVRVTWSRSKKSTHARPRSHASSNRYRAR